MRPDTSPLHVHLALFAAANAVAVTIWAAAGAGGGSWPFWALILWGSVLAIVVARSGDGS
jgi:hypothetical protein